MTGKKRRKEMKMSAFNKGITVMNGLRSYEYF